MHANCFVKDRKNMDMEEDKESLSGANKDKEKEDVVTVMLGRNVPATESPLLTTVEDMNEMFLRLRFSQTVAMKLVDDQGIVSPWTIASISDEDIATVWDVIRRPGGLVSSKMPDRENRISIPVAKNLELSAFMFKSMEHCSKAYSIKHVNSSSVLQYQHQCKLEQKKTDDTKMLKVDKNNWAKTMKNIVLHLKLVRGARRIC